VVELNITYIFQMLNFLAVWAILDRFFFRNVVVIIQNEQAIVQSVEQSIEKEQKVLIEVQQQQHAQWEKSKEKFKQQAPTIEAAVDFSYSEVLSPRIKEINKSSKQQLIQETKEVLIKRILENG